MRPCTAVAVCFLGLISAWGVLHAQRPFKEYPAIEYENFPIPPDFNTKTEWVRARLRYPDIYGYPQRELMMSSGREFPGYWTMITRARTAISWPPSAASLASTRAWPSR
jgi:hypothetical protein